MLTTAQATVLGRSVVAFRQQWELAGVMTFIDQLATDPRPAIVLWQQVVTRAADPRSLTPKALLEPLPVEAQVRRLPEPPSRDDPACPEHGGTIRDDQGRYACCKYDADPKPPAYLRCGVSAGPSVEARELIETRLGPRRRAREMSEQKEQREVSETDDRVEIGTALRLLDKEKPRPMACCPRDGGPLIATFERRGAEFHCLGCGGWFGFLSPTPKDPTPELEALYADLKAAFDAGTRGPS